ncbi:transposase [Methylosinus sp. C49]|uniref:transposase n=1 Tax=Methylosinus sp. C49 TaxID=2699395 RepID=UPI001FCF2233|nr:transposase [Methylosinus sp. C49]
MAKESGIATPNAEDLARFDRKRKGKKLSNDDWTSATDAEAKIARMKDGTTHLAYKPEHAVDLDTGVIVAAPIHEADKGDTTTLGDTLETAKANLTAVGLAPTPDDPCEIIADKGYHSREVLKGRRRRRVEEPDQRAFAGEWPFALAGRRRSARRRLRQPGTAEIGRWTRRHAQAR